MQSLWHWRRPDCNLTATIDNKAITVELGKVEVLDDTKNPQ